MQIDRRITNGLAWAGAFLVVGIPAADFAVRTLAPVPQPQVSVVEERVSVPPTPAPITQRPADPEPAVRPVSEPAVTATRPVAAKPVPQTPKSDPAAAGRSGDAVDAFLQSGRPLPSYISDGNDTAPAVAPAATPTPVRKPSPVAEEPPQQAALPPPVLNEASPARPLKIAPQPMPLSMRPASTLAPQPVPVINDPVPIVGADELEDWESGPLNEFLERRRAAGGSLDEYDPDGFFLDEGPNRRPRDGRFPRAYEDEEFFIAR